MVQSAGEEREDERLFGVLLHEYSLRVHRRTWQSGPHVLGCGWPVTVSDDSAELRSR